MINALVPQIQEQIVENVQVIPREVVPERFNEQFVDFLVSPIVAHAAPAPVVNECVAPARDVAHGTPAPEVDVPMHNQVGQESFPTTLNPEGLHQPSLTSPTDSEQVPSKRRGRTRYTPLTGIMETVIYVVPNAWTPTRRA